MDCQSQISAVLDELCILAAGKSIKFLAYVVVTPDGSQRVITGKADPLHVAGSFEYMKLKILLQEMREYERNYDGESPPARGAQ